GISREDQDRWALRSHERAAKAIEDGKFRDEIVPVGEFAVDQGPRRDTSYEKLSKLPPVFDPEGTTTAGNAPGVNDGAGALVVTSEEFARKRGLEVLATIVSQAYVADEFAYLARTPAMAGERALAKMGKSLAKLVEKGGPPPEEVTARVRAVDGLVSADLMIEAVVEDGEVKAEIFRRADEVLPREAVLASNTSSIPIGSLA